MKAVKFLAAVLALFAAQAAIASFIDASANGDSKRWKAYWSGNGNFDGADCRVQHFRRTFDLDKVPESFKIRVSADNRFILYVNGALVARGPARGDFFNWHYDTLDIARHLKSGKNAVAALVWNAGSFAPLAQFSRKTAFILDGETPAEDFLATPKNWKMKESAAYKPLPVRGLYAGAGDFIDGEKYDWNWTLPEFDDSSWYRAQAREHAYTRDSPYGAIGYCLSPRKIPRMQETQIRFAQIRRAEGISGALNFIEGGKPLCVPPNAKCKILLDNRVLTTAYPVLITSGGKGSRIAVKYGEALFDSKGKKGDRGDIEGRDFEPNRTLSDVFLPDGGKGREFSTLWFRTYRYVGLEIETGAEPLSIDDFYGLFTAYPFEEVGKFLSNDKSIDKIWEVGWRTARLCANETYFDCPYYEQLQYVGDTRIQALISLYVSGDDRLMRQAISAFNASRAYFGLTRSRYPSSLDQFIPPFSLYWIQMLGDFAMHRDDPAFVAENLQTVRTVLDWFFKRLDPEKNILKPRLPFWNFADWSVSDPATKGDNSTGWVRGAPPESESAGSAINTLHLALACRDAASLMRRMGDIRSAKEYSAAADKIAGAVRERCFDKSRGVFVDFEGAKSSSQHVNIMAILAGAVEGDEARALLKKTVSDKTLTQCTFYYRFYLCEAMRKTGLGGMYVGQLGYWRDMIKIGLTTFAENPEPTRSDCHAWSSSPNYHLLSLVCGIAPAEYGFKSVRIEPNLGGLSEVFGRVPHPLGIIEVRVKKNIYGMCDADIILPKGLDGVFVFRGKEFKLRAGKNNFSIR